MATTFPTTVDTSTQLYTAVNGIATTLNGALNISDTTVNVVDTTNFPSVGYFVVDSEIIKYTGKTGTSFTGCTRGSDSSSAATHLTAAPASAYIVADHHNVLMNAAIAIEQNISDRFGLGATSIVIPSGVVTFSIDTTVFVVKTATDLVGVGTANPKKRLTVVDASSSSTSVGSNPIVWIGGATGGANTVVELGFTYGLAGAYSETYAPVTIGYQMISGSGFTKGDFIVATRSVTTDTQATERFRINSVGQTLHSDGVAATPSISFIADTDTGLRGNAANALFFVTNATDRWVITGSGDFSAANLTEKILISDGTVSSPGIQFGNDANTGIYRVSADVMNVTCGGVDVASFITSAGTALARFPDGLAAACGISFVLDGDTGFVRTGANAFGAYAGGAVAVSWDTDNTAGGTRMFIYSNDSGTQKRISLGASDSGGAGFKLLRVPN